MESKSHMRSPILRWTTVLLLVHVPCVAFAPSRPRPSRMRTWNAASARSRRFAAPSDGAGDPANSPPAAESLLLSDLKRDLSSLSELRPAKAPPPTGLWPARPSFLDVDCSLPLAIVSAGSSYTRIWTHDTWDQHSFPPHRRYVRHLRRWYLSTTARKVSPTVAFACAWGVLVSSLARSYQVGAAPAVLKTAMEWSSPTFSFLSAPLALLLTLRANASMARLLEARGAWGRMVLGTRTLSSILRTHVFPVHPSGAVLSVRYLALLGWLLKAQLRGESEESQRDVMRLMLGNDNDPRRDDEEYRWLMGQKKRTVALTSRVRRVCAAALSAASDNATSIDRTSAQLMIEERLRELEVCVGICERLFGSPIPPTYSRHLSRVISLWILLLPVSLISSGVSTVAGVACATTVAAYVFVGLDEVGMEIENVFQIMPMQQLAAAAQGDAGDQFLSEMPALENF